MLSLNKVMLIGNLTRDPEIRITPAGTQVTSFGLATNRRWQSAEGTEQNATEFHEIVAWGKLAEICAQILKKGHPAYVEGRIQTRSWESADGSKRYRTEIVAENVIALSKKGEIVAEAVPEEPVSSSEEQKSALEKESEKTTKKAKEEKQTKEKVSEEVSLEDLDDVPF